MASAENLNFKDTLDRLDQITQAVKDPELPLDKVLDLYEEAVSLGLAAADALEDGIDLDALAEQPEQPEQPEQAGQSPVQSPEVDQAGTDAAPQL